VGVSGSDQREEMMEKNTSIYSRQNDGDGLEEKEAC
jgi:hypothetical protein